MSDFDDLDLRAFDEPPLPAEPEDGDQVWIIYDERGHQSTGRAAVLVTCETFREVRDWRVSFAGNSAVYRYTFTNGVAGDETYLGRLGDQ